MLIKMDKDKRPAFGSRFLTEEANVFSHNAWDSVEWTAEQENEAKQITESHSAHPVSEERRHELLINAASNWDTFYDKHDNKFFKDRHWLFTEFPELLEFTNATSCGNSSQLDGLKNDEDTDLNQSLVKAFPGESKQFKVLEVGCGAGNTIFPLLQVNQSKDLFVYGCDYSKSAVDVVLNYRDYDPLRCHVFVHDISKEQQFPLPQNSLDVIVMIFVLSALEFDKMKATIKRISRLLKPGGIILFRDYGRYDMAQLRFKKNRLISKNFYSRGDGTLVYFFTQSEVREIFTSNGFIEKQNIIDRRLQVNRARQLKMYRVWIQAKFYKPK